MTLEHARRLLKSLDENIAFEECERSPATVLGVAASARTIGSVLSVLIAGFLFAFEGYNSSRQNGWEYGGDGVRWDGQPARGVIRCPPTPPADSPS